MRSGVEILVVVAAIFLFKQLEATLGLRLLGSALIARGLFDLWKGQLTYRWSWSGPQRTVGGWLANTIALATSVLGVLMWLLPEWFMRHW